MKKLPILTIALTVLAVGGYQVASALQSDSKVTGSEQQEGVQTIQVKTLTQSDADSLALVQQARNRLFERQSVQAEMTEVVALGEYKFQSRGGYASAAGFRYRLEYIVELGDLRGQFLEVCDGQVLHTRKQISDVKAGPASTDVPDVELTRRDIQRIRREAIAIRENVKGEELAAALRAAEVGIGGLPAVLASLERSLYFDAVQSEMIDGTEFLVVEGRWRADRKDRLFTGLGGASKQVAGFMPDLVQIHFNRETLFPHKFTYLQFTSKEQNAARPLVTVEYKNVVLDQPVADQLFVYVAPPGLEEKDETAAFLEAMRQSAELEEQVQGK